MALALPAFVVLKSVSNGKYLCPVVGDGQAYGSLQLSGENVFAPYAKYRVEAAQDGLVHIRCCYNNKYWVRRSEGDHRIAALATEPDGERSKWSCTLFEPIINGTVGTVRFRHVQLNRYVSVMPSSDDIEISPEEPAVEFKFINWGLLFELPKHVAFKDDRSRYLSARQIKNNCIQCITGNDEHNYMQFTGEDIADQAVRNDIIAAADGFVRIMSYGRGKFWRRDPRANWIWADSSDNDPIGNDLFWPVKISDRVIALRSNVNGLYCRRDTENSCRKNCLRAAVEEPIREAHLVVEETVRARIIHNVNFRLTDARVQRDTVDMYASHCIINNSPSDSVEELSFEYRKTRRSNWSSSASLMFGVNLTITAGLPSISEAGLGISSEISQAIRWGNEEETSTKITRRNGVTVAPMATMTIKVTAIRGKFEIPFSYTQLDTLTNGQEVSYRKDDGVYFGENYFEFKQSNEHNPINAI